MKPLKYGMVGGGPGSFVGEQHRRAIRLDGMADLVAGCFSRYSEKNNMICDKWKISDDRRYCDYLEMAEKEKERADKIDFVVIATPNANHYPAAKAFLNAGIHVVCDKPLCIDSSEGEELECLAKEKELLFMVTYTYMGHVTAKSICRNIKEGKIGKIRMIMAEYPQDGIAKMKYLDLKPSGWRLDKEQGGSTYCMADIGTHVENAVVSMTGLKVKRVLAKLDTMIPETILDDNDMVLVELEDGATGMFWMSKIALGHANNFKVRIFGEKGAIEWDQEKCEEYKLFDGEGNLSICRRTNKHPGIGASEYSRLPAGHTEGFLEAMANLYVSFICCIRAKQDGTFTEELIDFPTVSEGLQGIRFVEACVESSKNGNVWIQVAEKSVK